MRLDLSFMSFMAIVLMLLGGVGFVLGAIGLAPFDLSPIAFAALGVAMALVGFVMHQGVRNA